MQRRQFLRGVVASGATAAFAGCISDAGGTPTKTPTQENVVTMHQTGGDYFFDPIGLFVEPGTTVTWEVASGTHSSTAYVKGKELATVTRIPEGADYWNSGTLMEKGATFEHTFETEGTYDYYCIPHKTLGMVGRIVVGEPGGPAEGSMPPDGKVPKSSAIVERGAISYEEFSG